MGSTWFYERQRHGALHGAVVLDLCGHDVAVPGLEDVFFVIGAESDPALSDVVRRVALPDVRIIASLNRYIGDQSDYLVFRRHRQPYLFFTCGRWPHYHAVTDTPDRLNYVKMLGIAAAVGTAVEQMSGAVLRGPFEATDTAALEIELFERHAAPLLAALGIELRGRAEIDALAGRLLADFRL